MFFCQSNCGSSKVNFLHIGTLLALRAVVLSSYVLLGIETPHTASISSIGYLSQSLAMVSTRLH